MSRLLVLQELADRVDQLSTSIPINQQTGELLAYVDPSIVTEELNDEYHYKSLTGNTRNKLKEVNQNNSLQVLEKATVPLDYSEGYPTVDGYPFWERLDGEPQEYYHMFKYYRDTILRGEVRTFAATARQFDVKPSLISALRTIYQWEKRVEAFDQKRKIEREMQRAHYIKELEDEHHKAAKRVFNKCLDYFEHFKNKMDPNTALKWFKTATELSRLSLGLSPKKPDAEAVKNLQQTLVQINQNNTDASTQNTLHAVAQGTSSGDKKKEAEHMQEVIDILSDTGLLKVDKDQDGADDNLGGRLGDVNE